MMSAPVIITVPVNVRDIPGPNFRGHWGARHKANARARLCAAWAWAEAGRPRFDGPVVVDILIVCDGQQRDPDAHLASMKPLIDGIFSGNATPDDSGKWVRYGRIEWEDGARPYVRFAIRRDDERATGNRSVRA